MSKEVSCIGVIPRYILCSRILWKFIILGRLLLIMNSKMPNHLGSPEEYYASLLNNAVCNIKDSLRTLRQNRVKGKHTSNLPLLRICQKLTAAYGSLPSCFCPRFDLSYVDVTLDTSRPEILHILPYLLTSYLFNYSSNKTMQPKIPRDHNIMQPTNPYSVDRFLLYEDTQSWNYSDDGIKRNHSNYKRAVERQAKQFTLPFTYGHVIFGIPYPIASGKAFDENAANIYWKTHLFSSVMILCQQEPSYIGKISYNESLRLMISCFPFTHLELLAGLLMAGNCIAGSDEEQAPLEFAKRVQTLLPAKLLQEFERGKICLDYPSPLFTPIS